MSSRPYHRGDLRTELLRATEEIMREEGVSQVSLRAVARRVEVSHAAPAHHFSNKSGLLTAFAAQGFDRLAGAVRREVDALAEGASGAERLEAVGRGYVRFALAHPEQFGAMFRLDLLDKDDEGLAAAALGALDLLLAAVRECRMEGALRADDEWPTALSAWALVHGLSLLLASGWLDGRLDGKDPDVVTAELTKHFVSRMLDS
jgi:AcrR family transcriptional regulator